MSKIPSLVAALLLGTLASACGSSGADPDDVRGAPGADQPEPAATYVVTGVTDGGKARPLVPGSEIRFTFADGHLGIQAGCNGMGGDYTLEGSTLRVTGIGGTDMGCDQALMDQDAWVAGLFDGPVELVTGDDASITSGDVVLRMADRRVVAPDLPLAGTRWVLDSVSTGSGPDGAVGSVPAGQEGALQVTGRGARLLNSCGTLAAAGTVDGDAIRWRTGRLTKDRCAGEEPLTALVGTTTTYAITEGRLMLTHADGGLGFRAVDAVR